MDFTSLKSTATAGKGSLGSNALLAAPGVRRLHPLQGGETSHFGKGMNPALLQL